MKKPSCILSAALSAGLTLLLVSSGRADDSFPPCWRGTPGTTYQNWAFAVSNNPAAPDTFSNPNGTPQATLTQGPFATGWKASSLSRSGVWDLGQSGQVSLAIPNFGGSPVSWKYVQVQVTYLDAPGFFLAPVASIAGATLIDSQTVSNQTVGPGVWRTQKTLWLMQPSPASETVVLTGDASKGLVIDQIIVDTRSPGNSDGDVAAFQPCWRGQAGSTFQQWLFGVSNNPAAITPELVTNSYGMPQATIVPGPFSSGYIGEDPFLGCRQGIWDLGRFGTMTLGIPNDPVGSAGSYKYVQVQVTQYRDGLYDASAAVTISGATLLGSHRVTNETTGFGGVWIVEQTIWRLGPPCPANESILITAGAQGSLIDQVVVDTLCLDFTCPSDIVANADPGQCSKANVTYPLPSVNGCTVTNVTSTPPSGSTFPVGTNQVTSVIKDSQGGSRTCVFYVVVLDNQPPTVICPPNMTVARNTSQCGAFVTFAATPMDNCPGATAGCNPPSGSLFPLGLTTVTCLATDAVGNVSAPCTFTVRVVDLGGDVAAFQPCWRGQTGSTYQDWAFSVSNNPASIPADMVTNAYGAPAASLVIGPFGTGFIESDPFLGCRQGIWDLGRFGTMTLGIPNDPAGSAGSYKYVQVQVTQYRDGLYDASAAVTISGATLLGSHRVTNETTGFGGVWIVEQTIWRLGPPCPANESVLITAGAQGSLIDQVVVDTLCLDFICPSDIVVNADPGQCSKTNVTFVTPAVNGCTVTNVTSTPPSGSTFPVGTNLVTTVIKDSQGGSRTCVFHVAVLDNQPPTVICPPNMVVARDPAQCGAFVSFAATPADNCSGATAGCNPPSGSLFPLGLTTVTCLATDAVGNVSAPCTFTVRVQDLGGDVAGFQPCWRGQPTSTYQDWVFSVSNNPASIPADLVTNAYGAPSASLVIGPFGVGFIESDPFLGCRQGIWDLGRFGTMTLGIPNDPVGTATSYKYVQVQVTQYRDGLYDASAAVSISGAALVGSHRVTNETTGFGGVWIVEQTIWRLGPPCPANESILITAGAQGSLIDQVVVDTLCLDFPCPSNLSFNADPGKCSKSNVTWVLPAVNGCTVTNVTSSPTNGSTFPVGTNVVTSTIFDSQGGTRSCSFTVVVNDTQPPVAQCKNITVNLDNSGAATITGADVDNGSTDNCGIATRSVSPSSFTCANRGPNNVTLTVTDFQGLVSTCNATVTVKDITPPVFAGCPANITVQTGPGRLTCNQVATWTAPTATDNCAVTNLSANHASGETFPVGVTTVTYIAKDSSSNVSTCTFTVTVVDNTPPVISGCPGNITVQTGPGRLTCNQVATWTPPTATDNCSVTNFSANHSPGEAFPVGVTTVIYTARDAGNNATTCAFTVTVQDNTPPTLSNCPSNIVVQTGPGRATCDQVASWTEPDASDNCAVVVFTSNHSPGETFPVGVTTVTYVAQDVANNTGTCSFTVTVQDTTPPVISGCPANITVQTGPGRLTCDKPVTWTAPTASDDCSVTNFTSNHARGETFPVGTTTVTYVAIDASSNVATCSFTVTVQDNTPPTITCPPDLLDVSTSPGICTATNVSLGVPVATNDNCGLLRVTNDAPAIYPKGTNIVHWTAVDVNGNTAVCSQLVVVRDHQLPVIANCPGNITVLTGPGRLTCNQVATWTAPTATDNCAVTNLSANHASGEAFPVGVTTVTYVAIDSSSNVATCSFTVTVKDTTPPIISGCPGNITVQTGPGRLTCNQVASWTPPTATDNCSVTNFSANHNPGDLFPVGVTTVTYTARDAGNNVATCSFTVTVQDNTPPVMTGCPTNIIVQTGPGRTTCDQVVNWDEPVPSDNCEVVVFTSDHSPGDTFPVGTTTVTYIAKDVPGNTATCVFTVTVVDNTPPLITTCPTNRTFFGCSATVPNMTNQVVATDNCSTNLTITQSPPAGTTITNAATIVNVNVQDTHGNVSTCPVTITLAAPPITITHVGLNVTLTWSTGILVQSHDVTGPYTPVPGATSPYTVPGPLIDQTFYRTKCP